MKVFLLNIQFDKALPLVAFGMAQEKDIWLECAFEVENSDTADSYIYLIQGETIISYAADYEIPLEDMCSNSADWDRNCTIAENLITIAWSSEYISQDITIDRATGAFRQVMTGTEWDATGTCRKIKTPIPKAKF